MRYLASLKTFLETGTLGPLTREANLLQVDELFGPPQEWTFTPDDIRPLHWIYNDRESYLSLNIIFEPVAPYPVKSISFEEGGFEEAFETFGYHLAVTTDGFDRELRPSDFLRSDLWKDRDVRIFFSGHEDRLVIAVTFRTVSKALMLGETKTIRRSCTSPGSTKTSNSASWMRT
ncbi:hypothetical protein SAMN05216548_1011 [Faunimonas pinastri]|uniref:Uncharacterized protein n=1 Tax=Faunimonas pinastri TaxID=1855383 RepID=A0A1H8Z0W7_9HYPH|nr:hypothetical protein [Faunimonas pinastri]SEP58095.1 hypothetical protein SAMN05216548_1011 [Faunimonas pinastri]